MAKANKKKKSTTPDVVVSEIDTVESSSASKENSVITASGPFGNKFKFPEPAKIISRINLYKELEEIKARLDSLESKLNNK